jgi:hypothetical protein
MIDHDDYDCSHLALPKTLIAIVAVFAVVEIAMVVLLVRCWS